MWKWFLDVLDVLYKLAGIFAVVGVFIAWQSLHTALYPQDIEGNQNYLDMANAGDTYSQMFLAEHYFEIGEYGDAIYWYKLATINKGTYQAAAYNNLGVIYARGFGLSDSESDGFYRFQKAYQLFRAASNLGLPQGKENAIYVLRTNDRKCFPDISEIEINSLLKNSYSEVESSAYETFVIYKGPVFWENNTKYTYSGSVLMPWNDTQLVRTYYMYYGQTYKDNIEITPYEFVRLEDINN